jgi:hypothetical protein
MTHRDQIESAIREWGGRDRAELPKHLRNPQNEHDFALAMAVGLHDQYPEVTPIYDGPGDLTGWRGIELRDPNF